MDLAGLTQYYAGLLAYEYRGLPNADRQMQLYVKQFIADAFAQQVNAAFNLDTAVGAQLDIIGKWVGVPRNIGSPLAQGYFGFWSYGSSRDITKYQGTWVPATDTPTIPSASGGNNGNWYVASANGTSTAPIAATFTTGDVIFSNGSVWAKETADNGNGFTDYNDYLVNLNGQFYDYSFSGGLNTNLSDTAYRLVIKLKIATNTSDGSLSSIMALLWAFFGSTITLTDNTDMTLSYNVSPLVTLPTSVLATYLPRPMGVGTNFGAPILTGLLLTEGGDFITTEGGDYLQITS